MFRSEGPDRFALEVDHADDLVLDHQGHRDLRSNPLDSGHVALVLAGIPHQHGLLREGRGADDALAELQRFPLDALVIAHAKVMFEHVAAFFEQQNAERVVGNDRPHQPRDLLEQLVKIQDAVELLRDLRQRAQRPVLPERGAVELRRIDGQRKARADQLQQFALVVAERVRLGRLHVDHAHQLAARHQRHSDLRAHVFNRFHVAGVVADIVGDHRLHLGAGRPGDAFPDLDAHVADNVVAITRSELNPQRTLAALEQDSDQLVLDHLANQRDQLAQ